MICRHCGAEASRVLIDLGSAPPSNAYLTEASLLQPESWLPLKVLVCESCWLVQVEASSRAADLFGAEYAYFSSFSADWLRHALEFVALACARFSLGAASLVLEIAANDGYLLQYVAERGIPCVGVEPTAGTAAAARAKGLEIVEDFFGVRLARELVAGGRCADLVVANNVLAHVPDPNDFCSGIALVLAPQGVVSFEFPHLMRMIEAREFDTIYHEHYSYLSLTAVSRILERSGLELFDVEELPTHGGSLRVYAQRADAGSRGVGPRVAELLERERAAGMQSAGYYAGFQQQADRLKDEFLGFLIQAKRDGKKVVAYGAAAKGNTLLNYAGIRPDLIPCVVDRNPAKQGKYLPGSRVPILDEACIAKLRPDYVVILPWNLREEVTRQLAYIRQWGGRFVTAVPSLKVE